jgi:hypothetical protein
MQIVVECRMERQIALLKLETLQSFGKNTV